MICLRRIGMFPKMENSSVKRNCENRAVSILKWMNEPDWNLYRSFLAVLRERSLSAAARSLNLTQPTLARHIDALDAALGFELFTRSQQGLAPTEAALELAPYAENVAAN